MKISDIFGMSLTNLWRRKMRTVLTVLGVIIGTASIVVMLSLGIGLKESMMAQVGTAGGLTEIQVSSDMEFGSADEVLLGDNTIETFMEIEHVEKVSPQLWFNMPIQVGKYENYIALTGVTDEFLREIELGEGKRPKDKGNLELVVGNQVLTDFFDYTTGTYPYWEDDEIPNVDLLNTPVIAGIEKESVGNDSQEETGSGDYEDPTFSVDDSVFSTDNSFAGSGDSDEDSDEDGESSNSSDVSYSEDEDVDDMLSYSNFTESTKRVPIKISGITAGDSETYTDYSYNCYTNIDALKEFLKKNYTLNEVVPGQPTDKSGKPYRDLKYSQLVVKVDKADNVETVLETIQNMGYRAEANKEWLEETEKTFLIVEAVLGGIGAVALLVAAIGIANTMTMSTYERTKEIGIMKVLGCSLGNIRSMFLTEAAFIGLLGGIVGVGLSFLLSMVVNKFLAPTLVSELIAEVGTDAAISVIPVWLVAVSIVFSTIIGMVAGFFPAQRATKLSPLAAIRNE